MKKIYLLIAPLLIMAAGCQKANIQTVAPSGPPPNGYIEVTCDVCRVDYGMPDQYAGFDLNGKSQKSTFHYKSGYSLETYITPKNHDQKVVLSIYNNQTDKLMYTDTVTQKVNTIWQTNVVLTDNN